jgi:superfamily II DNA/RNA helicase
VHRIGRTGRAGRAGTAISLVAPADHKSVLAIEKLIGQPIPRTEGGIELSESSEASAPSGRDGERAAGSRRRNGNRESNFGSSREGASETRKPRREREPRRPGGGSRNNSAQPKPQSHDPVAAFTPPVAPPAPRTPSIGRVQAPQAPRAEVSEPADHSHLPAFLLRPVRARG